MLQLWNLLYGWSINETGGEIPGATDQQLRQWKASGHQQDEKMLEIINNEQEESMQ